MAVMAQVRKRSDRASALITKHPERWTPAHATPKHQAACGSSAREQGWAVSAAGVPAWRPIDRHTQRPIGQSYTTSIYSQALK